jgi:transposase
MQLDELLKQLPRSKKNAGAKSKYGHKAVLRAIIHFLQAGCQWNELPPGSPPSSTVNSQFRRWEKSGFIKKVKAFLASKAEMPQV